ncbi:MAG TPA: dihydrolipoyl dehydrogenase [Polyangiaceae bacterium]|nr:dihydrolipoyl dehydrogenase [Polyangiaceae bacterium]
MTEHDLIVIGAGPGGYVAAIRAAQLGLNVACIEAEPALGGTCLRIGCIPSKVLLEASERFHEASHSLASFGVVVPSVGLDLPTMMKRKESVVNSLTQGVAFLFKKNKVTHYRGWGQIAAPGRVVVEQQSGDGLELSARAILIATGSSPATLPGVEFDGDRVGSSTEALSYPEVPEHLVVIGAGYIGLEMGSVWARLGAKVTVLEYLDRILPGMDAELAQEAKKVFEKQGIVFQLGSKVTAAHATKAGPTKTGARVEIAGQPAIECDRVLVSVGRVPNTRDLGLEALGVELGPRGFIPVNEHFETQVAGVFAIGDVIGGAMLAHKAEEEGVACVEHMVTGYGHVNYAAIPGVVYTHPEIASVGQNEEQLKAAGVSYKKGVFPFVANGRAKALGSTEGRVKILAHAETDRVLGVHIIGPRAGDLIAEAAAAIEFGASSEDIARTCHAHPTLAEVVKEAALAVDGRALHI